MGPALERDGQCFGRRRRRGGLGVVGRHEAFDEHLLGRDAERGQAGLGDVHVRAGPADVEVGVRLLAGEGRARGGVEEAVLGVEMMMDGEPPAGFVAEAFELGGEDHALRVAVRVHEGDPAGGRRQRALDDRDHRGDTAAARERDDGHVGVAQDEQAGRSQHVDGVARPERVVHPVRHAAAGHALDRRDEGIAGVGAARHRVAADDRFAVDGRPERAELPGPVRERRGQGGRHVEHERTGVGRLLDDVDHRERVVFVLVLHGGSRSPSPDDKAISVNGKPDLHDW